MDGFAVEYTPANPVSPKVFWAVFGVCAVMLSVQVILLLAHHGGRHWAGLTVAMACWPVALVLRVRNSRRRYVADSRGIHAAPICEEPWDRIDSIVDPGRWGSITKVRLVTGQVRNTGFPAWYAQRLAECGNKPLR